MNIKITVKVAFWLKWYVASLALMCYITRCEPDPEKFDYWVRKALAFELEG